MTRFFNTKTLCLVLGIVLASHFVITAAQAGHGTGPSASSASPLEADLAWENLEPEEQRLLRPHVRQWRHYPLDLRLRLRNGARRFLQLAPAKCRTIRERALRFEQSSREEKRRICDRYYRERGRTPPFCRPPLYPR